MDIELIREARLRQPFRPFFLRTKNGRTLYISRPEYLAVSPRALGVINHRNGAGITLWPDEVESLQYEDVNDAGRT